MSREHKRSKITITAFVVLAVAFLGSVGIGLAQQRAAQANPEQRFYQWLGLSSEQQQGAQQAAPNFWEESERVADDLARARRELATALMDEASTDAQLRARLDEAMLAEEALEVLAAEYVLQLRPLLDAEQRTRLMELLATGLEERAGAHLQGRAMRADP